MKTSAKASLIGAGYIGAILVAVAIAAIFGASSRPPDQQASDGMAAFSDSLFFLAAFGIAATLPTGAALFWLRPWRPFWPTLGAVALAIAVTGLAACITYVLTRTAEAGSALHAWSALAVLRTLVAPLFALAFFLAGVFAPVRWPRMILFTAAAIEAAAFAGVASIWFLLPRTF